MVFSFFKKGVSKLSSALSKTRQFFTSKLKSLLSRDLNDEVLEELEQALYEADFGITLSQALVERLRSAKEKELEGRLELLKKSLLEDLGEAKDFDQELLSSSAPQVIFMVGANGQGKTTTSAKLASRYQKAGKKVLLVGADTFRAAGSSQMMHWAEKVGVEVVGGKQGQDAAAIVYDALQAAQARGIDLVIVDTAGRLHSKTPLIEELSKMGRVADKVIAGAPHHTLLVLDATVGQNALETARVFQEAAQVSGLVLTKLDGSAKGGIVVQVKRQYHLPIYFVGLGEQEEDLQVFDPAGFVDALFE